MASRGWTAISDEHFELRRHDDAAFRLLIEFYARTRRKAGLAKASKGAVHLGAGQCVFGYREIADCLGLTLSKVRFAARRLEARYRFIDLDATRFGTVVTIPFVQEFQNSTASRTHGNTRGARKPHLTDTAKIKTVVGSNSSASPIKDAEDGRARELKRLYKLQEKLRNATLGERYTPLPLHVVRAEIAQRLAEYTPEQCERVLRADAQEVRNTGKGRYFGKATWSAKNFAIKLAHVADVEAERAERRGPPVPWKHQRRRLERKLRGFVEFYGGSERDVLLTHYFEFAKRFHREKATWPKVRRFWNSAKREWNVSHTSRRSSSSSAISKWTASGTKTLMNTSSPGVTQG